MEVRRKTLLTTQVQTKLQLLVRQEARLKNMEFNIDSLTEQIVIPTFMVKKNDSSAEEEIQKSSSKEGDYKIVCFYCKENSHTSGSCEKNTNKDFRRQNFPKI